MATLKEMFEPYLADRFPAGTEFADNGETCLRITQLLENPIEGRRYAQRIAVWFEPNVLTEFQSALDAGNVPRQDRIGDLLDEIVGRRLEAYDPAGPESEAFKIEIDDRALDL